MTQAEWLKQIAEETESSEKQVYAIIKAFVAMVKREDRVYVAGLGTFKKKLVPARVVETAMMKNGPKEVPEHVSLRFKETRGGE